MKLLIVGGNFDHSGGSPSKIVDMMYQAVSQCPEMEDIMLINGGSMEALKSITYAEHDVLLWMPNISNDEDKILPNIKVENPRLTLISSKRVVEKSYTEGDVIGRLLKSKSNLGIMITSHEGRYQFKLLDPLGNCYSDSDDIPTLMSDLITRLRFVKSLTRIGSTNVGDKKEFTIDKEFIKFVRHSADEFSKHVNAVNPNRLLGNASTRCMYGFPAERQQERLFVTQRNIDKQLIQAEGFVEVLPREDIVEYYGEKKPSVDTPIQIKLFNYYSNINFMVHGHVYVEDGPFTESKIPCGFVEEFNEVVNLYPNKDETLIVVNLRGHGCLLMAQSVDALWSVGKYMSREFPEY